MDVSALSHPRPTWGSEGSPRPRWLAGGGPRRPTASYFGAGGVPAYRPYPSALPDRAGR
jgi:hypothetical protein